MVKNTQMQDALKFEVIEGGLAEPKVAGQGPKSDDWLRTLEQDSWFLCKPTTQKVMKFSSYGIAGVIPEAVLLGESTPEGLSFMWVDSEIFSNTYKFVALLQNPPKEEEVKSEHNLLEPASGEDNDGHEGSA